MLYPSRRSYDIFDEMFRNAVRGAAGVSESPTKLMKTDIKETKDAFVISMDLPGYSKEDIKAELKEGYLTVSATKETSAENTENEGQYIRKERFQGTCKRSFYVGDYLKESDIKASYKDGVLDLTFPKEPEPVIEEPKYIAID